jgi:adenosylhomocysteine nucleosidase
MLIFVAAEPREYVGLLTHCIEVKSIDLPVNWARQAELNGTTILMIANGAGAGQAAKAVDAAPEAHAIVSTGFCGALDPNLHIGDIFVATEIENLPVRLPETSRRYARGTLASIDHVAQTALEKSKLRATGAAAVEMEAAGVARRADARGLPFFCVRSVTDLAGETFANDLNAALRPNGQFDTMQILRSAIRHPLARLPELMRLRQRCEIAARSLGAFLADCRF